MRPGHGQSMILTSLGAMDLRWRYLALASVFVVAITPMMPVLVVRAPGSTAGSMPTTGMESSARRLSAQTAVAVLQAMTMAFTSFLRRCETSACVRSRMKSSVLSPQGAKPQSAA